MIKRLTKKSLNFFWGLKLIKSDVDLGLLDMINFSYGHAETKRKKKPINRSGEPVPWFTYPAIEFLSQFDLSQKDVFEWGSGNSTLFFADRVKSITSIEFDREWFEYVSQALKDYPNGQVRLCENTEDYVNSIQGFGREFDLIIVDANNRIPCTEMAIKMLRESGIVILDNSDWFPEAAELLRQSGFLEVDFHGIGPINNYSWCTSIFFKSLNNLPLLKERQPQFAIGGLKKASHEVLGQKIIK